MKRSATAFAVLIVMIFAGAVFVAPAAAQAAPDAGGNNTTSGNETVETDDSQWSKARILATVQDHVSRHSTVDIDSMESWYDDNRDRFSDVEQRYVEAWIQWYRTGDRPTEGLHPSLQQVTNGGGEQPSGPSNITAADLDRGTKRISDGVTVRGYEFDNGNLTAVIHAQQPTTVSISDQARIRDTGQYVAAEYSLDEGKNVIKIPAHMYEGDQMILIVDGRDGAALVDEDPPFIDDVIAEDLWVVAGAVLLAAGGFALQWFLRRERIYQEYRPAARLIAGQVNNSSRLLNRFTSDDEEVDDESDDGVRGLLKRYASLRSLASTAIKVALLAFVAHSLGWIDLPLPTVGDEIKIFLSFLGMGYIIGAPAVLKPILEALYNPTLEKIQELDSDGKKIGSFWAKKGTFRSDYEVAETATGSVPTRETATGQRCYLVRDIDRDERTVEPAFSWQAEQVEEIEGLDEAEVEWLGDETIAIDEILADPRKASIVLQDMLVEARNGKEIRKAFPFVRLKVALEEAKDVAIGINRAVSGGSVEGILADMISSYESKEEQIEEQFEEETDIEKSLNEIEQKLDSSTSDDDSDGETIPVQGGGDDE